MKLRKGQGEVVLPPLHPSSLTWKELWDLEKINDDPCISFEIMWGPATLRFDGKSKFHFKISTRISWRKNNVTWHYYEKWNFRAWAILGFGIEQKSIYAQIVLICPRNLFKTWLNAPTAGFELAVSGQDNLANNSANFELTNQTLTWRNLTSISRTKIKFDEQKWDLANFILNFANYRIFI